MLMSVKASIREKAKITEWITGGPYAVAVEVKATMFPERPGEPFLTPDTVRFLEEVARNAQAGNLEALKKVGTVFVRMETSKVR